MADYNTFADRKYEIINGWNSKVIARHRTHAMTLRTANQWQVKPYHEAILYYIFHKFSIVKRHQRPLWFDSI